MKPLPLLTDPLTPPILPLPPPPQVVGPSLLYAGVPPQIRADIFHVCVFEVQSGPTLRRRPEAPAHLGRSSRQSSEIFIIYSQLSSSCSAAPGPSPVGGVEPVGELSGVVTAEHTSWFSLGWRGPRFISSSIRGGQNHDAPTFLSDSETTVCRLGTC